VVHDTPGKQPDAGKLFKSPPKPRIKTGRVAGRLFFLMGSGLSGQASSEKDLLKFLMLMYNEKIYARRRNGLSMFRT